MPEPLVALVGLSHDQLRIARGVLGMIGLVLMAWWLVRVLRGRRR